VDYVRVYNLKPKGDAPGPGAVSGDAETKEVVGRSRRESRNALDP